MWDLEYKECWALKSWCFWTVVLEKTLESPLDCKEIQPVHPKGDQSWVFIGRTDAEGETPILWPPDVKIGLIGRDPDAGKDWEQEEKGTTEDKMAGWHHRLNGHGFGWTLGVGDKQGGLACCSSWGHKESDTTERLRSTEQPSHYFRFFLEAEIYIKSFFFFLSYSSRPPCTCGMFYGSQESWEKCIYVFLHYWGKHISGKYIVCHSVSRKKSIYIQLNFIPFILGKLPELLKW